MVQGGFRVGAPVPAHISWGPCLRAAIAAARFWGTGWAAANALRTFSVTYGGARELGERVLQSGSTHDRPKLAGSIMLYVNHFVPFLLYIIKGCLANASLRTHPPGRMWGVRTSLCGHIVMCYDEHDGVEQLV